MAETIQAEMADMHRRLAALCHLSENQWQARTRQIEHRVTSLAEHVNQRRLERFEAQVLRTTGERPTERDGDSRRPVCSARAAGSAAARVWPSKRPTTAWPW